MTDGSQLTSTPKPASSLFKAITIGSLYFDICQNVTPAIVGYCCAHWPLLKEATWFELVVFSEGALGSAMVWLSWKNVIDAIVGGIKALRAAKQQIEGAVDGK